MSFAMRALSVTGFCFVIVFSCASFFFEYNDYRVNDPNTGDFYCCDFHMRMNEAQCVREGINPFDVWDGTVDKMPYVPNNRQDLWTSERNEFINAYTPWSYPLMIPLTCLSRTLAWRVFYAFMVLCVAVLGWLGFCWGRTKFGSAVAGMFTAAFALAIPYAMNYNLLAGNYCILIAAAIVGMAVALDRGRDVLAGIFWAIAMIKPQIAIYLAIPLLLKRKFLVCCVAAGICLALLALTSCLCSTSPVKLIGDAANGSAFWFTGTGLVPSDVLVAVMKHGVRRETAIAVSGVMGLFICGILTWMLRKTADWIVLFIPATVCAVTCNYENGYNFCVCSVFLIAIATTILSSRRPAGAFIVLLLPILFAIRLYDSFAFVIGQKMESLRAIGLWRWGSIPSDFNMSMHTWSSTGLLLCAIAYCCWFATRNRDTNEVSPA